MKLIESLKEQLRDRVTQPMMDALVLAGVSGLLSLMITSIVWKLDQPIQYVPGNIASQTVRAPHDLIVEDALTTEKRRAEALSAVKFVFTASSDRASEPLLHLSYLFSALRELGGANADGQGKLVLTQENRSEIERRFRLNLAGEEWGVIATPSQWPQLEAAVKSIVDPIVTKGILADKHPLRSALSKHEAILREKNGGKEDVLVSESSLYDVDEALTKATMSFPAAGFGAGPVFDSLVRKLMALTLQPNVVFDSEETDKRMKDARDRIDASMLRIQRGQVLVREGELVTPSQQALLSHFQKDHHPRSAFRIYAGYWLLSLVLILTTFLYTLHFWPGFRLSTKDVILAAACLFGTFLFMKLFAILGAALSYSYPFIDANSLILAAPLAAGGTLLQVTLGPAAVFSYTLLLSLLTGVFLEESWLPLLLMACGNLVGALNVRTCSRRSAFIYSGVRIAAVNLVVTGCFLILYPKLSLEANASMLLFTAIGGLMSGILAGGFAPFAEYFGGYFTDIKLLELASLDRPLLRELSLQAPGTWNHSMVMGQIAEAAAESIGANPLLARVGAFYHDIGKVSKPAYFVENQMGRENRHDKLTPSMSALIIKSHVKEGIELALEHKLPEALIDFIPQHHGNSLIEYFYEKALRDAEEGEEVDESHYRYPGPRPQTKEAGILMLADATEAASRTLSDPSPAKIQGLVQKIINKVFASGELNECDLTLQDLHLIAKSFTRVLTGIYHRRVEYSEPAEKTRDTARAKPKPEEAGEDTVAAGEGRAASETEGASHCQDTVSPDGDEEDDTEPLKRLGMH